MPATLQTPHWESEVSSLLDDLASAQTDLLDVLNEKRQALSDVDTSGVEQLQQREEEVLQRLHDCQARRSTLLGQASESSAAESLARLAEQLPGGRRSPLSRR